MTGLIFDIRRFSVNDGPGIRTSVFFKGCPLSCAWCHNPESRNPFPEELTLNRRIGDKSFACSETAGKQMYVDEVVAAVMQDVIVYDESGGGVTLTGGEPLYQFEFLKFLLVEFDRKGIHTALDTCGYAKKNELLEIISYVDLFLFDIKHMVDSEHIKYTGVSNVSILENFRLIADTGKCVIPRIPVIPKVNDTSENISLLTDYLSGFTEKIKEIHLLPFHNTAKGKYEKMYMKNNFEHLSSLSKDELIPFKKQLELTGIKVKIIS